jgi:class 3 adenylate cyclase
MPSERVQRQIDRLLDEAEEALGRSEWTRVRELAGNTLRLDPDNQDARAYLAAAERDDGRSDAETSSERQDVAKSQGPASPAPPLPRSFANGRYTVRSFLGEGAKKRVYLVNDTKLDRDVAFALIKTDGLDADGLVRVRREAQAMGRLGDHTHIVTIFDTGDEAGAPFIVSQYRGGGAVEDMLAKADQHRIAPDRAMRIAAQVCDALAHAHGRGIIHRDLKPGNVWLDADGNAALGDFGLAVAVDRSRMTMQGMMVGTVAYMAPEQALGRTPDARSDLYALGAMLYEMVTGRPPFLGDDAVGVISQHINTPPVDPSWHAPECPKPLEALIVRLLAKSPDDRPPSAQDVAQELRRILDRSTVDTIHPAAPDAATDLRALNWGMFVGRREEMEGLKQSLEGALSGKGSLAMLVGEPGIGKTRLAEEFAVYAGLRGAQVLTGHCYEGESSLPYRPFVEACRQYTRSRPDAELRAQLGPGAPEIATLVSEIRQRFPDIEVAAKLDPDAERLRLFESITEFLHNASSAQPLVLHLDDIHWADKPSLLLLQHLAQRTAHDRLLILGAYRDVELERTHPLAEVLGNLRRLPNYRRVLLRGLPRESVEDLLTMLNPGEEGAAGRQALAAALHQETEGNPFFVREVLAHLVETGKIVHEDGRWVGRVASVSELGIPEGVREVIGRRLSRMSDGCNRMLTLASTMTGGFTWEALKAINGDVPEAQLLDLLEEALGAQLIAERKGEGAGTYDFTHALIRQTLYEELSTPRRVLLHRQIGESLEQLYADNTDAHLPELAHHFYQAAPGGDVQKAIDYARRAGDRAMSQFAWEEAANQYELALQAMDLAGATDPVTRCSVLASLASARGATLDPEAVATAQRAFDAAEATGDAELMARVALDYVRTLDRGGVLPVLQAAPALGRALAARGAGDSPVTARLLAWLAYARFSGSPGGITPRDEGQLRDGVAEARAMADRTGNSGARIDVLDRTYWALMTPATTRQRLDLANEWLQLAKDVGDRRQVLAALNFRLLALAELGDMDAVWAESEAACGLADATREPFWTGWRSAYGATRAVLEGRYADAERFIGEYAPFALRTQHLGFLAMLQSHLYNVRRGQGRLNELIAPLEGIAERTGGGPLVVYALAFAHLETGQTEKARAAYERLAGSALAAMADITSTAAFALAAGIVRRFGDTEQAALLYDALLPCAELQVTAGPIGLMNASVSHPLGQLAATMKRWDDAERHFEYALAFDERIHAWPWLARCRYEYALMLHERGAAGDSERARALVDQAIAAFDEMGMPKDLESALALKLELQGVASSDIYTSIDNVARAVERERPQVTVHPAPDGTVTIMFSDIEDSTVLTERLGDQAWQDLLRKHNSLIREQLKAYDGYEVKTMGDGFMVAFQSAKKALDCAIAIQRALDAHNAADGQHVKVRIGLHAGEMIREGDDFYGKNVIMASRVAGKAAGGEILVSSLLRSLVESSVDPAMFAAPQEVELKGLAGSHTVYRVEIAS